MSGHGRGFLSSSFSAATAGDGSRRSASGHRGVMLHSSSESSPDWIQTRYNLLAGLDRSCMQHPPGGRSVLEPSHWLYPQPTSRSPWQEIVFFCLALLDFLTLSLFGLRERFNAYVAKGDAGRLPALPDTHALRALLRGPDERSSLALGISKSVIPLASRYSEPAAIEPHVFLSEPSRIQACKAHDPQGRVASPLEHRVARILDGEPVRTAATLKRAASSGTRLTVRRALAVVWLSARQTWNALLDALIVRLDPARKPHLARVPPTGPEVGELSHGMGALYEALPAGQELDDWVDDTLDPQDSAFGARSSFSGHGRSSLLSGRSSYVGESFDLAASYGRQSTSSGHRSGDSGGGGDRRSRRSRRFSPYASSDGSFHY